MKTELRFKPKFLSNQFFCNNQSILNDFSVKLTNLKCTKSTFAHIEYNLHYTQIYNLPIVTKSKVQGGGKVKVFFVNICK